MTASWGAGLPLTAARPAVAGSHIEFPPGRVDVVAKFSSMIPDDPTTTLTDSEFEEHAVRLDFAVTPRWGMLRLA